MHELTLGWDFEHARPIVLVDRVSDFPTGEALWVDITFTNLARAGVASLVIGLGLLALWRLRRPPSHRPVVGG